MNAILRTIQIGVFLSVAFCVSSQTVERFRVMCYNVENYFDCKDDSLKEDSEYLYGGLRRWSATKKKQKQMHIAKVIAAVGEWDQPALVGLCEVENETCLTELTKYGGLASFGYRYVHYESPDVRGIDVALLYDRRQFRPLHHEPISVIFPDKARPTRDILYTKGLMHKRDTLHVFLCHFSSRYGGQAESEPRRIYTASVLRRRVDSILTLDPHSNILLMGDFNDYPSDVSMSQTLRGLSLGDTPPQVSELYNLMFPFDEKNIGTHKHQGDWGCLDQILVSGALIDTLSSTHTSPQDVHIFSPSFLLEEDEKYLGTKPFRTYVGYKYNAGFSDHLPIYIDLWLE